MTTITSGIIDLDILLQYALQDSVGAALHGNSSAGRSLGKLTKIVTSSIVDECGFYLWGSYEANGLWRNRYLGKAGYGKTSHLRARITEELRDERCFLWSAILEQDKILALGRQHYESMWYKCEAGWLRSLKKAKTSHIIWVSTPELENAQVHDVEADLIETFNPIANVSRPTPPATLQTDTKEIIGHFRYRIHKHRPPRSARHKVKVEAAHDNISEQVIGINESISVVF